MITATQPGANLGAVAGVYTTVQVVESSSLFFRIASAAGTAIGFLITTTERVGSLGAGFATGLAVLDGKFDDAAKVAIYSFLAFSVLNASKLIVFGPGAFVYSTFVDCTLASVGFGTGFAVGTLKHLR